MGNGCICFQNIGYQYDDIKLDSLLEEQIQNNKENEQLEVTNLYTIAKYFNEGEKEINIKLEKKNLKRIISHKKAKNMKSYNNTGDSKYELMLKRLLEQKKIERKGPKRRKTLRINNNKESIKLIESVINEENEKNKKENEKIEKNESGVVGDPKRGSILLNDKDKNNINNGRKSFNITKYEHKKIKDNFEGTEINTSGFINDIKNINNNINNISNYISDANYACFPMNNSPKKQLKTIYIFFGNIEFNNISMYLQVIIIINIKYLLKINEK